MSNTADYDRGGPAAWSARRPAFFESPWHPGWIILTVLGFIIWWPVGLALLFFTLWSRKMTCMTRYNGPNRWAAKMERKLERMRARMEGRGFDFGSFGGFGGPPSSGNRAFDEYRMETLRRLEEEQSEFKDFLDRLRHAKDKAEFDQFMSERRNRPSPPSDQPQS